MAMKIERNTVATFHYDLSDEAGQVIESSRGGDPMAALYGAGNVIPGIESALAERVAGERFSINVPPAQGYGERREGLQQRVQKKYFRDPARLKPGMRTVLTTKEDGQRMVTVLKVGASVVDVDLNHPMAGRTLMFDIEVIDVRAASAEEIAHGHAHAPGGHAH
jgi:FKBP-type peptidyl-prolyl cis-trans isomerase SlyD